MEVQINTIDPHTELITAQKNPSWATDAMKLIEECGRVSHKSEGRITDKSAEPFVRKIAINYGHESILEHATFTVCMIGSRTMSHQLVRHRIAAYCVTAETELVAYSTSGRSPKKWTIGQLNDWQNDPKRKGRLKLIRLRSVDSDGQIVPGKIKKIIDTGLQHVFDVKTRCGKRLRCTDNEWFKTNTGWAQLHNLSTGDRVLVNGTLAYRNKAWLQKCYLDMNLERTEVARLAGVSDACIGKWVKKFGLQKPKSQYPGRKAGHGVQGMHTEEEKVKISSRMQGDKNHAWKGDKASKQAGRKRARGIYNLENCDCCDSSATHRHHIDENPLNNSEENVIPLCDKCHAGHHIGQAVLVVHETPITSILAVGIERTFDIEMETEDDTLRNYVASGFVVHNTQESQRYCDYSDDKKHNALKVVIPGLEGGRAFSLRTSSVYEGNGSRHGWGLPKLESAQFKYVRNALHSYRDYLELREEGEPAEDAREVLPNSCKTEVYATYNLRTWRHMFRVRLDSHAQHQIKKCTREVFDYFKNTCPLLVEGLVTMSGEVLV